MANLQKNNSYCKFSKTASLFIQHPLRNNEIISQINTWQVLHLTAGVIYATADISSEARLLSQVKLNTKTLVRRNKASIKQQ